MALIASKWGKITVNTVIEYIHDLSAYANLFEYYEKNENERWTITLMHELGAKWSTFLTQYIGEAFVAAGEPPQNKNSNPDLTCKVTDKSARKKKLTAPIHLKKKKKNHK